MTPQERDILTEWMRTVRSCLIDLRDQIVPHGFNNDIRLIRDINRLSELADKLKAQNPT